MLISVLFLTVLTLMFVGAAVDLAPSAWRRTGAAAGEAAAQRAAQSGLEWVRARISEDPQWNASAAATFSAPGLSVTEGSGQVVGWVQDNGGWSRFRIRFNYQDGATSAAPGSDAMNDPADLWDDFPYVSCNNLLGGAIRNIPVAQSGTSYSSSSAWANTQLTLPPNMLLASVEGSFARSVRMSGSAPVDFASPLVHKKVSQVVLRLGNNQPITEAAIMAAGDLLLDPLGSTAQLKATAGEPARLRSRGSIHVEGSISSARGELMSSGGTTITGTSSGITTPGEDGSGFYKIPLDKVRAPISPATLSAGVYVVTNTGSVLRYDMDYPTFATTTPRPAGTPVALPSGMSVVGPNPSPAPKFSILVTKDVQITPNGSLTDFALIPEGGAPQSAPYGAVPSASPSAAPPPTASVSVNYWFSGAGSAPPLSNTAQLVAWQNFATNSGSLSYLGTGAPGGAAPGTTYRRYSIPPGGGTLWIPDTLPNTTDYYPWITTTSKSDLAALLAQPANASYLGALQTEIPLPGSPSPSPSASATPTLAPKDLELQLRGGAAGLTFANEGNIVIGAQIEGNGSAIVATGANGNISLIGTSTDLSSSPGSQLGINLYATGTITLDAFKLDSSGSSFGGVNLKGVMYAWHDINVLVGNSSSSAPFTMRGSMVAYGGDPASNPTPGAAQALVRAGSVDLTYDPSYVTTLLNSGPFTLSVVALHEF